MALRLIVEEYGKIQRAEVEISPLTLFVGDNNSGKSYLLSLIWAIFSGNQNHIIYSGIEELARVECKDMFDEIHSLLVANSISHEQQPVVIKERDIFVLVNKLLKKNKEELIRSIFNYNEMSVKNIEIETSLDREIVVSKKDHGTDALWYHVKISGEDKGVSIGFGPSVDINSIAPVRILQLIAEMLINDRTRKSGVYYLPAARTGFMLAKNTLNQVSRNKTFDIVVEADSGQNEKITPFPKPIIHFLDVMDDLDVQERESRYSDIVKWIISNMSKGDVQCVEENNGNIQYVPNGAEHGIPLRAASGVVTELTPLILLLKYAKMMRTICYEEPEMCLHPELQLQMARLLIRMTNNNINIIATTHSDIIIQHVNNMCQLKGSQEYAKWLMKLGLDEYDLIKANRVSIYQFNDNEGVTSVEKIIPDGNTFNVTSFIDALRRILEQSTNVFNIVNGEED